MQGCDHQLVPTRRGLYQALKSEVIIIIKSLDPLRAKKTFIRKKLGHTAVSAIKASSVTLEIWQNIRPSTKVGPLIQMTDV